MSTAPDEEPVVATGDDTLGESEAQKKDKQVYDEFSEHAEPERRALQLLQIQMELVADHERKMLGLIEALKDEELDREAFESQRDEQRRDLISSLKATYEKIEANASDRVYEDILYNHLTNKMARFLGYYKAIQRASKDANKFNDSLGDRVAEVDEKDLIDLLNKLDEVNMVRLICRGTGMDDKDTDLIIGRIARKSFPMKDGS